MEKREIVKWPCVQKMPSAIQAEKVAFVQKFVFLSFRYYIQTDRQNEELTNMQLDRQRDVLT